VHIIDLAQQVYAMIFAGKLERHPRTKRKLEDAVVFESEGQIGPE